MSNDEQYIQMIKRYLRDRERELLVELQKAYAKPKQALIIGTQLSEIQNLAKVLQELSHEAYK